NILDGKEKRFQFDGIFPGFASNRQVYYQIGKPLIDAAFKGFNGTLMAYGQTGTGKTYTQMSQDGVCMLSVQKLFRRIQNDVFHEYKVYMSYLQIYQEKIFDLLNPNHKLEMILREDPKKGIYVENLTEYVVRGAEEVMSMIRSGKKRLIFAETKMNRLSSSDATGHLAPYRGSEMLGSDAESVDSLRSASVPGLFEIDGNESFEEEEDDDDEVFLQSIKIRDDIVTKGRVNICDLAGSERVKRAQVDGERLSELQHINLSLLELGNTIHALSEGNRTHIPFRNSTLTRLLQDSLGGNCKTIFVMCVSPSKVDINETRCTLEFGQRALKIKNTAYINMEVDFVKLAADLRRQLEAQELEIQTRKESYEKEVFKLQSNQLVKLAERESLLEQEKHLVREEAEKLRLENENLQKLLEEERQMKSTLEKEQEAVLEKSLQDESQSNTRLSEHQKEIERLKQELKEEKRRSLLLEEREKSKIESLLEAERQHVAEIQLRERQKFESELEEERKRIAEQRKQAEKDFRDACCQSSSEDMINMELPPVVPTDSESTSTETFYNVLLAEIMSLQLLYQMQDIADVCNGVAPRSTDSGWADYDDELLENMGINLLEKGGFILDSLRAVQSGDIISIASADSLRDAFLFQFPSSPKLSCNTDERSNQSTALKVSRDLMSEFERKAKSPCNDSSSTIGSKVSSDFWSDNNNSGSGTSSSMGSYCDQEPLSPRQTRQTSDSGCEMSPVDPRLNLQKEMVGSNVCVPLAEEDDEDFIDESVKQMRILKDRVSTLDVELVRLKNELDRETVNFFSAVFLVDLSGYGEDDSPRLMRYLFDCVRDKLCIEIAARVGNKEHCDQELELPLSALEQAVNLLLVNKTVMSCILVLQNRARTNEDELGIESMSEMCATLVPEEITKLNEYLSFSDTGTCTDPVLKSPVHHRECQTSDDWTLPRSPVLSIDENDGQASGTDSQDQDPWSKNFEKIMSGDPLYSEDLTLLSRDIARVPDGASDETGDSRPGSSNRDAVEFTDKSEEEHVIIESEDEEVEDQSKRKKKRMNLLSCLGSKARVSFRRKPKKKADVRTVKSDKEK
ncbi:hypothetical protein QZH41_019506, partial [Actinostola sp. cb2023]